MKRGPSFSIVTAVVTILAILGFCIELCQPLLPAPIPYSTFSDRGDFLQGAKTEQIRWTPLQGSDFQQAAHRGRPVMILSGAVWSYLSRSADKISFSDPDIQALIGSEFVPIRIDCDESPEWLNAFFPVSRYKLGVQRGCQVSFLSPNGWLYDYAPADAFSSNYDNVTVTQGLLRSRGDYNASVASEGGAQPELAQRRDINLLMAGHRPVWPNSADAMRSIAGATDMRNGGLPDNGVQGLATEAYRFSIKVRAHNLLRTTFDPVLRSPLQDWLEGGFFNAADQDWTGLRFDKVAVVNAGMMLDCALEGALYKDDYAAQAGKRTFDCLSGPFMRDGGLIASCRIGDEDENGRSPKSSFSPVDLRPLWNSQILSESDRQWAVAHLNLNPAKNPQLIPYVSDRQVFDGQRARLDQVLDQLRSAKSLVPVPYGTIGYADVNGYVCARMIECARLWGEPDRTATALQLADRLEAFRSGDNLDHWLTQHHGGPELTDYLGYSDAALQVFLATGNTTALKRGLSVLLEAQRLFELNTPGAWLMAHGSPGGLPRDYLCPELADNLYESCTAREIRLMTAYARLLSGDASYSAVCARLTTEAQAAILQFEPAANELGYHACGYYSAALDFMQPSYAFVVGPKSVQISNELFGLAPTCLVAPAVGLVRPNLTTVQAGIYVVRGDQTVGPLKDIRQAAAILNQR